MQRQYFGTDGIRGTVGEPPITPDFILRLGHAVGRVLKRSEERPTVLIGKDTRISGYMLESALESGFNSAGVDVVLLGPLPTPGVAYLTRAQRASLGVVISASHNPFPDNGIKFFSAQGSKLSDSWEMAVEEALAEAPVWADSASLGKARRLDDAAGRYIEFCKSTYAHDLTLKGLKIVVDAAHGAAYHIAPKVFHELGADVVAIGCAPDGLNINHEVGATHPDALVRTVRANHADFGIALDGDADITGTDVSESLLTQAREENHKVNNAVKFQQLDFNQPFDLPSDTYDLVSACFAIYYAQDIPFTLSEMHRVLKPGGRLFTTGPMPNNKAVFYEIIKEATGKPIPPMPGSSRYASEIYGTMQQLFSKVEQHIFENPLTFPTVEPFMEYTRASMSEDRRLWNSLFVTHEDFEKVMTQIEEAARKRIERDGKIVMTKFVGGFIATK